MTKLITADVVAQKRFRLKDHREFMRVTSGRFLAQGRLRTMWNGKDVGGRALMPIVDNGRVLAVCDICGNPEYVEPADPIFFCMVCGNGDKVYARPVDFPEDWARVRAALEAREIELGRGKDVIERVYRSSPKAGGLGRVWQAGVSADELEAENGA